LFEGVLEGGKSSICSKKLLSLLRVSKKIRHEKGRNTKKSSGEKEETWK